MIADGRGVELTNLDGVVAYQDHAVPSLFYYTATRPRVARAGFDYQLSLVEYARPLNDQAGTLSCVIDLEPTDDEMERLDQQLCERFGGPVRLEAVPWTAGTVTTVVRGGRPDRYAPSLVGRNSALLHTNLSVEQNVLLTSALNGGDPNVVSVVYQLSYDVLRTAFQGRITFDQERYRSWVQDRCSGAFLFISFESSSTFEELRSADVVRLELIDATDAGFPALRTAFMRALQAIMGPEPRFADTPGGDSPWLIGFSCEHLADEQRMQRAAAINLQLQAVEPRSMVLQAPLLGVLDAYRAVRRTPIDLDAQRFTQRITFSCIASFTTRGLRTAIVRVTGPDESQHAFDASDPEDWEVELVHPRGKKDHYEYSVELVFADDTSISRAPTTIAREQSFIFVVAAEMYTLQRYTIETAYDFPWQLIRNVRVEVTPPASGQAHPTAVELGAEQPTGGVDIFVRPAWNIEPLDYTVTHNPSRSGSRFDLPGRSVGTTIFLNELEKRQVVFEADPTFDWSSVESLTVTVRPPRGTLTSDKQRLPLLNGRDSATFTYWMYKPEHRALPYTLRYVMKNQPTPRVVDQRTTGALVELLPPEET